jgi:hypothetical protein
VRRSDNIARDDNCIYRARADLYKIGRSRCDRRNSKRSNANEKLEPTGTTEIDGEGRRCGADSSVDRLAVNILLYTENGLAIFLMVTMRESASSSLEYTAPK